MGSTPTSAHRISRAASSSERGPSHTYCGRARQASKSGSPRTSSSFSAPTNRTVSSSRRASPTSRNSGQSVRRPLVPKHTAIVVASGSGAGNESAAEGMRIASRPAPRSSSTSVLETANTRSARAEASACSSSSRARERGLASGAAGVRSNRPYQSSHSGQRAKTARANGHWNGWNIIAATGWPGTFSRAACAEPRASPSQRGSRPSPP